MGITPVSNELNQLPCSNNDEAFATPTSPHLNKPVRIAGASITDFHYGPDHELYKEVSGTKTTYKLAGGVYEINVDRRYG